VAVGTRDRRLSCIFTVLSHLFRDSPTGLEAFAVVLASVLPDLIDKPLAWEYGVFENGYAIGHSLFFAVPLAILVGMIAHARRHGRGSLSRSDSVTCHIPLATL